MKMIKHINGNPYDSKKYEWYEIPMPAKADAWDQGYKQACNDILNFLSDGLAGGWSNQEDIPYDIEQWLMIDKGVDLTNK